MAMWAIPTAIAALIVHSIRLNMLDRSLDRRFGNKQNKSAGKGE
jgi:uncharacterized membrane protein